MAAAGFLRPQGTHIRHESCFGIVEWRIRWADFLPQESKLGEVVRFVPKSELERARLIREARAIYASIFPAAEPVGEQRDPKR